MRIKGKKLARRKPSSHTRKQDQVRNFDVGKVEKTKDKSRKTKVTCLRCRIGRQAKNSLLSALQLQQNDLSTMNNELRTTKLTYVT